MCVFYAAFVGSASACRRGMISVAVHLVTHAKSVAQRWGLQESLPAALSGEVMDALEVAYSVADECLIQYRSHALG